MVLYGANGHAKVIIDCITSNDEEVTYLFDETTDLVSLNGYEVINEYDSQIDADERIIIALEDNIRRQRIARSVKHLFGKVIHPSASVSNYAHIGEGSVIMHNTVIQTGTRIGKHCILNTNSSVDYDSNIGDYCHISPKVTLCSNVKVGEGVHIGAGATVIPNITIGKWCVVGAGAVITQNLPDFSLVVGVPGKVIRKIDKED